MTTHKQSKASTQSNHHINHAENQTMSTAIDQTVTPETIGSTALATGVVLPPSNVKIPPPPAGFTPIKGGFGRTVKPRKAESVAMTGAVEELKRFADYASVLGKTVAPQDQVIAMFDAANQWTQMRLMTDAWGVYVANEEGILWTGLRSIFARLGPAFALALQGDPTLATRFPKLTTVLAARKAIAKKSASTRSANNKEKAAGQQPTHGAAAKKALKAAAAAENAADQQPPVAKQDPAPAPAAGAANGAGTNGAAHA